MARKRVKRDDFQIFKDGFFNVEEHCPDFNYLVGYCIDPPDKTSWKEKEQRRLSRKQKLDYEK